MGCAEMLVVGLIDLIAADLRVSIADAGALVTANALGIAVGGPVLTVLTARLDRRTVLIGAAAVFALANTLPAFVADYPTFLTARVVIGATQGLFTAAAFTTATAIVPPERSGRAMGLVIAGFASASAFGLPLGTLLGQAVGWRGAFVAVVAVSVVIAGAGMALLPRVPSDPGVRAAGLARHAFAPRVLAVLAVGALLFAAIQSALTYLVPFLGEVTGVTGPLVGVYLLAYGVATTVGSSFGGRFADGNASRGLIVGAVGVVAALLLLATFGGNPVIALAGVLLTGLCCMGAAPSLQHRVVTLAGAGAPLAAALPASAANAGIALGSTAGGIATHSGVTAAVLCGAAIGGVAVTAAAMTARLRAPAPLSDPAPAPVPTR